MKSALLILFVTILIHFCAEFLGVYDYQIAQGTVWIDNMLHVLIGVASGLFWHDFSLKKKFVFRHIVLTIVAFVVFIACVWEGIEFSFFTFFPEFAIELKIYSPTIGEAFVDVFSNVLGGTCVVLLLDFNKVTPS